MQIALVSTFARVAPVLTHWVAHHRALGVQHFYLFVDDPAELSTYTALPLGKVQLIARDEKLRTAWQQARDWAFHSQFVDRQVYSRQCLNANLAMEFARRDGCDWLIHLDSDELLHVPEGQPSLATYLTSKGHFDLVAFTNHEAVPEQWHVDDYFAEVTLFKRNAMVLDASQKEIAQRLFAPQYFLAYANGKSAVNLRGRGTEADGTHAFRPAAVIHIETTLCVLHYTQCGFNWFFEKFATLGEFDGQLMDLGDITRPFPMLAHGRDSVVRGRIHDATRLYRDRLLNQGGLPHTLHALLAAGVLWRVGDSPLQTI